MELVRFLSTDWTEKHSGVNIILGLLLEGVKSYLFSVHVLQYIFSLGHDYKMQQRCGSLFLFVAVPLAPASYLPLQLSRTHTPPSDTDKP